MELWSEGIYLLGVYGEARTGCWLLYHGAKGAILEMPPYSVGQWSPTITAQIACEQWGLGIEYLLCSHAHDDHISDITLRELHKAFPDASVHLHAGFKSAVPEGLPVQYFGGQLRLDLGGEPLFLVHAPKHSWTDTMVVFRGVIFTGDWELNTIRSIHDGHGKYSVPNKTKLQSIEALKRFVLEQNYLIHRAFSIHANDRRDNIDFIALMNDTKADRTFW
jgi:hydroxyacylglutathione hydrolase